MFAMTKKDYDELQAYRATGFTPTQVNTLLNDPDEAPKPLIDESIPTPDDFWNDK